MSRNVLNRAVHASRYGDAMTSHHPTPDHILWIDLETTDNDPRYAHAAILEVGAIITRWAPDLPEVARASILIRPPGAQPDHDLMWARMPPVVQRMHTENGLWREATSSDQAWDLVSADRALAQWVVQQTGSEDRVPLAGSGVGHLDQPYVKEHLPQLAARLVYWPLDIGNVRRMLNLAGRSDLVDLGGDVDAKPHRGLEDVEMHVAEARRYLQVLGAIPTAHVGVVPSPEGVPPA